MSVLPQAAKTKDQSSQSYKYLITQVRAFEGRLRRKEGFTWVARAASAGLGLAVILALATRMAPLMFRFTLISLSLIVIVPLPLLALAAAWLRPRRLQNTARLCEQQFGLKERISTAIEIHEGKISTSPELTRLQLEDATRAALDLDPDAGLPIQRGPLLRYSLMAAAMGVVLLLAFVLPNPQEAILREHEEIKETIEEQTQELEELRLELSGDEAFLASPDSEEILKTLDELIKQLKEGNLTQEEALAAIGEAQDRLKEMENERLAKEDAMQKAAEALQKEEATSGVGDALAEGDTAGAAEELESLPESIADGTAGAEAADALRGAASALSETDPDLAERLEAAADAVESGDMEKAQQAAGEAADALREAGEGDGTGEAQGQALERLKEAAEQIAKQGGGASQSGGEGEGTGGGSGHGEGGEPADGLHADEGGKPMPFDNGPGEGRQGEDYDRVYAPEHLGGEGGPVVKPGGPDPESAPLPIGETPGDPNRDPGEAMVPYSEVYGEYSEAASEALDDGYIPLGYKSYVRRYFTSLEPEQ